MASMALVAVVSAVVRAALAPGHDALVAPGKCGFQDCAAFCRGHCPFMPNISAPRPVNLTVYRMTPYNLTGIADRDTGDAKGDLGCVSLPPSCTTPFSQVAC